MKKKNWRKFLIDIELNYLKTPLYQTIKKMGRESWLEEIIESEIFNSYLKETNNNIRTFKDIIKKSDKKVVKINTSNKKSGKTMIIDSETLIKSKATIIANPYHLKNLIIVKIMEIMSTDDMIFSMHLNKEMKQYLSEKVIDKAFTSVIAEVKNELFMSALKEKRN